MLPIPCCLQSLDQLGSESSSTCPFPLYQEKLCLQFQTLPSRWQFGLQKPFKTSLISKTVLRMKIHPKLKQDTYIHTYAHLLLNLSYWHRFKSMIIPTVGQGLGKRVAFIRCWWECKLVQPPGGQFGNAHQKPETCANPLVQQFNF